MRLFATIGVLAVAATAIAAAYLFMGYHSVAATAPEPQAVSWALAKIRNASIDRHATDSPPLSIDAATAVQAGARLFAQAGCVQCHGAPGKEWSKFAEGLNPGPPDLKDVGRNREPGKIFWAIRNGIRMSAMPAYTKAGLDDTQIWQITAFVKRLPKVSDDEFKVWTAAPAQ